MSRKNLNKDNSEKELIENKTILERKTYIRTILNIKQIKKDSPGKNKLKKDNSEKSEKGQI